MTAGCIERRAEGACREQSAGRGFRAPIFTLRHLSLLGQLSKLGTRGSPRRTSAFRNEVEKRIEQQIQSGTPRIGTVAAELGCSRQTLYRRLRRENVTFEQLCDSVRRRLALRFIRVEGLSVKEATYRLGFSDPSAFSRAFKRWTGSAPSAMRRA